MKKEKTKEVTIKNDENQKKSTFKTIFSRYKNKSLTSRIAFTGVFLGLVFLFQYLEHYMTFGATFLKFNFSLLFILPVFYFAGPWFGLFIIIFRFAIGPAMSGGYTRINLVGHVILMFSTLTAIGFMYLFSVIFRKIANHNKKIILISITTVLSTSLVLTILNALWFSPMYFYTFGLNKHIFDIPGSIESYNHEVFIQIAHFNIPNYWGGIFAVYFSGNLIKFTLIYVVYFPMSKVIKNFY